ncbi:hypothetical protein ADK67_24150 [Saccharothrix sp. NRRL B-16348]|uniref:hypothetical protein n=1 Tax=Saccharothrix sp. NRRL B-16348 TaxID=1415542 RepID=UPI0006AE96D3|nr:hypothetical protein [Saccharothrix sp. NRRL B-16348]KOX22336.1 hypothetical protein ADK67_24150 [Saccharothrix sp. NRRL B-16348]
MNSRRDSTDGPEDVDATFAEIVAGLEREGVGKQAFTDEVEPDDGDEAEPARSMRPEGQPAVATADDDPDAYPDSDTDSDDPNDHYVPPEPPPLPALRPGTIAALLLIVLGVVLLLFPGLFGLTGAIGTPLALIVMCSGAGWLILRMRNSQPPDSGWDDGAVL